MQENQRLYYLQKMGIQSWLLKDQKPSNDQAILSAGLIDVVPDLVDPDLSDWDKFVSSVEQCNRCKLGITRQAVVSGAGAQDADCLIIGEAPNDEEGQQGIPFVGDTGHLLNEMLFSVGLNRDNVYFTNIIKCCSAQGEGLDKESLTACRLYLNRQIEMIQPRIILLLGRVAAHTLLECSDEMSELRGKVHNFILNDQNFSVIVSYHPAYYLRKPSQKRLAWQDLSVLKQQLE